MKIVDLSHPIEPAMQIYPGDPVFSCCPAATLEKHGFNVTSFSMGSHTGTHLDAPFHFFDDGKKVDALSLGDLVGPVVVLRADRAPASAGGLGPRPRQLLTWDDLVRHSDPESFQKLEKGGARIVFIRTGWAAHWKTPRYLEHPFLERRVAEELLRRGVRVVGVDTLSPDETPQEGEEGEGGFGVHEVLLREGAVIVENLNLQGLEELPEGALIASLLPLKIEGCDGSPIRAVAWSVQV
ncbi:putative cyclase [Schizopora paradoxa]|uniref:Putative cyclase n=1 Tax=Schizopora paradoxa TaxID=27342 RepID=A0A0H2RD25_9AGAM|nr:putative cyclase [Schizopora paradoxa]